MEKEIKKEALKLADYLDNNIDAMYLSEQPHLDKAANMLRVLVAELDKKESKFKKYFEAWRFLNNGLIELNIDARKILGKNHEQ